MEEQKEPIKNDKKIYGINILIIVLIFIAIFTYMIKVDGKDNLIQLLHTADYKWVLMGIFCLIGMWIMESITLQIPLKKLYPNQKFGNSIKITMIGQLFNNLTPFASGGQIMQAYQLSKEGKRASDSMSILTMKFIITQLMLIIFTVVAVLFKFEFFLNLFQNYIWVGIIGILINISVIALFFLAATKKGFVMKIAKPIIRFFGKIHIGKFRLIKDSEAKIEKFENSVDNYSHQFKLMQKEKKMVVSMAIIGLIQNILYYAITYMIYKAFGNSGIGFLEIIVTQAFLMLIMTVTPTPGAGLGAEGGFLLLFNSIFKNGTINMSIFFWRIYVFYLPIIIGALFFASTKRNVKTKSKEM